MDPRSSSPPDSHVAQSSAAVQQAYAAAPAQQPHASSVAPVPQPTPSAPAPPAQEATVEQQWIEKAKEVVAKTQNDPFMQNKLMSELKVQYLASRYGKPAGEHQTK